VLPLQVPSEAIPRWLVGLLCAAAVVVLGPFAPWVVLAVWLGLWATRLHVRLLRPCHGRRGVAASITLLVLGMGLVPVAAVMTSLVVDAISLVQGLVHSDQVQQVLVKLARGDAADTTQEGLTSTSSLAGLLSHQGERAWEIAQQVAGATAHVVIGMFVLIAGIYGVLVDGASWYAWVERHAPMDAVTTKRFADAFVETGRGMAFGVLGAGMLQSIVATITYLILGVPAALPLGLLTLVFSVIPTVGTAIVWVPVALGLAITGRTEAAIALSVLGVGVIGTVDNLARPYLARRGQLQLPTYVVLLAMFGGIELIGAWGLVLGPLAVRLAKEAVLVASNRPS